ncbi:ComF family protein [Virgibacillus flavescens]|uniref:ComF family protein n=1 Tax=Virgibacillus flavescens TaxID=1611422 RepID=UPI003D33A77D
MECLWCDEEIILNMNWNNFLVLPARQPVCTECLKGLEVINGNRCRICSRPSVLDRCTDCKRWQKVIPSEYDIIKNHSIYTYNDFMQSILAKWKYRGDYCLGGIFKDQTQKSFKNVYGNLVKETVTVPIPLSEERQNERGFNQAEMIADFLPLETADVLKRIHGEKQSKKSRFERINTQNPFFLSETVKKTVILVDDIYTTGTTLRHAAVLLREAGCPEVYTFTLIRS